MLSSGSHFVRLAEGVDDTNLFVNDPRNYVFDHGRAALEVPGADRRDLITYTNRLDRPPRAVTQQHLGAGREAVPLVGNDFGLELGLLGGVAGHAFGKAHLEPVAHFFGEPMLDIKDWMRTDASGKGMINILSAEKLYQMPKLYAASLLWMLSELYEQLPEAGDLEKPKLVFFFDEAHLLFNDAPQVLLDKIEQVIRLIRSKGVGVWFVSQNPSDIPDNVLGQLGNRVQHALRAFTPKDQKAVKTAAQTMRANPAFDTEKAIQELGTGEALVSFLDAKGSPSVVERAMVIAPCSRMGPVTDDERNGLINHSSLYGKYEEDIDRESAYERLQQGVQASTEQQNTPPANGKAVEVDGGILGGLKDILFGSTGPRGGKRDGVVQSVAKSAARQVTNQIIRGMLGSLMGGRKR